MFIPGVFPDGTVSGDLQGTEGQGLLFDENGKLVPSDVAGGGGNLDGGQPDSNYGGTTPIDGGEA